MTRAVTLAAYAAVALAALALEVAARRRRRLATFGEALAAVLRFAAARLVLVVAWLWLGWHVFVRVHWR